MPFYFSFNLPFFNNYRYLYNSIPSKNGFSNNTSSSFNKKINFSDSTEKVSEEKEPSETFFEIFGLKLFFDDILIICILYFLYTEKIKDEELFICLILLLLS